MSSLLIQTRRVLTNNFGVTVFQKLLLFMLRSRQEPPQDQEWFSKWLRVRQYGLYGMVRCHILLRTGMGPSTDGSRGNETAPQQVPIGLFGRRIPSKCSSDEKTDLQGDSFTNCLSSCCCPCCEMMQTSKELDYIEVNQNPNAAPPAVGYQQNPGMVAAPQAQYHDPNQQQMPFTGSYVANTSVTHENIMPNPTVASQPAPAYGQNVQAGPVMPEKSAAAPQY
jgi:hypothetical protein